jgi:hypothetical protein
MKGVDFTQRELYSALNQHKENLIPRWQCLTGNSLTVDSVNVELWPFFLGKGATIVNVKCPIKNIWANSEKNRKIAEPFVHRSRYGWLF